ncbi:hypothetical protein [Allorhizocola rhizosphaerae]|uniref:hypothetical protein n=1 Tax=Allorhizocola rhizosphaerae TaxID=1872709 RepID=UPI0013C369A6|nr:hypothetical protein [Allorhizocola rhizosphaerae]
MGFIRRHGWWLLPELIVVAVLATVAAYLSGNAFQDQLSNRAQVELERLTPAQLELYDMQHAHAGGGQAKVVCTAESFGTEPAGAKRIEDVKVIYAQFLCALVQKGTPWDYASRSSGPAVITLGDPPAVQIAASGLGYRDRVQAIIPDDLEGRALAGFKDRGRPSELLLRYRQAAG